MGPKTIIVYKIQHSTLATITTCNAKFSSVKSCHCRALKHMFMMTSRSNIEPVSDKAQDLHRSSKS